MAFDRLTRLGPQKFQKIVNELIRGTPAQTLARLIQEWGDAQDVSEETLAKQLKRLHTAVGNGAFGGALAQQVKAKASVRIKLLHGSTLNCLDELIEIALIQKVRVDALYEKEQVSNTCIVALNTIINDYMDLLVAIQKIKFDLGVDEYKRTIPTLKASDGATPPDSAVVQRQVAAAYSGLEQVLARYSASKGLPAPP
jgi:hypothetical protein